jgi:hypothetical protein
LLGLLFYPEDGGVKSLKDVGLFSEPHGTTTKKILLFLSSQIFLSK